MSFSQRYGYKTARETLQLEDVDPPLRNGLWSLLELHVWKTARYSSGAYGGHYISEESNRELYEPPWILRRLQLLRRWSHEEVEQVLT
jgi:hypothetical protein